MARQRATVTVEGKGTTMERVRHEHGAFGVVTVMKPRGSETALFGSALRHRQAITVEVSRATLDRHLNRDWVSPRDAIVRFAMSEAQWAAMVSSIGSGSGTQVTLLDAPPPGTPIGPMPGLEQDPLRCTFEGEIGQSARDASGGVVAAQARIAEFLKPGAKGPTKKDLEELQGMLLAAGEHFAGTMEHVQRSFAEAMEKTVAAARTEIETFVGNLAMATGIEALRKGAPLLLDGGGGTPGDAAQAAPDADCAKPGRFPEGAG